MTKWKKGLAAKCRQVKQGYGKLRNDIDYLYLVALRNEKVIINNAFTKESRSSRISNEVLPTKGMKRSKRKRKERCDLNKDSTRNLGKE